MSDKLKAAKAALESARQLFKDVVESTSRSSAEHKEALKLLDQHRLDESAADALINDDERIAASKLQVAIAAIEKNRESSLAKAYLKEIVDEFPETEAAAKAQELIDSRGW